MPEAAGGVPNTEPHAPGMGSAGSKGSGFQLTIRGIYGLFFYRGARLSMGDDQRILIKSPEKVITSADVFEHTT